MAKKRRSAKQKAATRKLVRFNKSKGRKKRKSSRKSSSKRRSTGKKRKTKKRTQTKTRKMAKGKSKKTFIDKIPILKNKTVQKVAFGLGIGLVVVKAIDFIATVGPPALTGPLVKNKRIIQLGVEAVTEPLSAVVDVATGGGLGSLGGILKGGSQTTNMNNGNGFA